MQIIKPDIAFDNYFDLSKYKIAKGFTAIISLVFIVLFFFFWGEETDIFMYYAMAAIMMLSCLVFILFSTNYKIIFYIISILGTGLILGASNFGSHVIHYSTLSWSMLAIALAYFGTSIKVGNTLTVIHLINTPVFILFHLPENLQYLQGITMKQEIGTMIEFTSTVFLTAYIIYQFVLFHEYSRKTLQETNAKLEVKNKEISASNQENVTLLKEVHHRVKNNLQIIISLLRLQKEELHESSSKEKYDESINRILTMSLIHQKLYQTGKLSKLNLIDYVTDLFYEIKAVFGKEKNVDLKIQSTIPNLDLESVVSFGLLINELITNSFKHAFFNTEKGTIEISVEKTPVEIKLFYKDSGHWKTPNNNEPHFGLELVNTLTEQLEGSFERNESEYIFLLKNFEQ